LADVYAVIAWYLDHRAEVDCYLREQGALGEQARHETEGRRHTLCAAR
jgi:hypothetical protein